MSRISMRILKNVRFPSQAGFPPPQRGLPTPRQVRAESGKNRAAEKKLPIFGKTGA
jgi:hypothetical protein